MTWAVANASSRVGRSDVYLHSIIHLGKCFLCLFEKAEDDGFAELFFTILVHIEYLLEGSHIHIVAEVDLLALRTLVSLLFRRAWQLLCRCSNGQSRCSCVHYCL